MAWSPQLGMRVFDPQEGAKIGLAAGQAFASAYKSAQDNQLKERELERLEEETRRKASLLQLKQMGLSQLRDDMANGVPFQDALFKAGPKLYADKPEAIVAAIENRAKNEASAAYQQAQLRLRQEAADSLDTHRANQDADKAVQRRLEELRETGRESRAIMREEGIESRAAARDEASEKRFLEREESQEKRFTRQLRLRANADPQLKQIDSELTKQREALATGKHEWNPFLSKKDTLEKISGLENQRSIRLQELGLDPEIAPSPTAPPTAPAAPAASSAMSTPDESNTRLGTVRTQGGKKYVYVGGNPKDPSSWAEAK